MPAYEGETGKQGSQAKGEGEGEGQGNVVGLGLIGLPAYETIDLGPRTSSFGDFRGRGERVALHSALVVRKTDREH